MKKIKVLSEAGSRGARIRWGTSKKELIDELRKYLSKRQLEPFLSPKTTINHLEQFLGYIKYMQELKKHAKNI